MKNLMRKVPGLFIIASLFLSPALAFADHGGSGDARAGLQSSQSQSLVNTSANTRSGEDNGKNRNGSSSNRGPGSLPSGREENGNDCVLTPTGATSSPRMRRDNDGDDNRNCGVATTTPVTIAPTLSAIVTTPGTTTATVAFSTDVPAVGTVFYGTVNPFSFITALGNPAELTNHAFSLVGLAANTTYFYVVLASNAIGSAVSNLLTFTTAAVADVTPPVMSNVTATSTATSTATLTWTTNEPSTSKVFFGTTTPIDLLSSTTPFVANSALVTTHTITVTGLATSTTFHFVAQSSDASGNAATSSDVSLLIP